MITVQLIFILGTFMQPVPMADMDACQKALMSLSSTAKYRSYCIDGETGEVIDRQTPAVSWEGARDV